MVSFAEFVFNVWSWVFPAVQWFLKLMISPAPAFIVDFIGGFGTAIQWMGTIGNIVSNVPLFGLIFKFVGGLLNLIQSGFTLLTLLLGEVPLIVFLIVGIVVGGITSAVLDWFNKTMDTLQGAFLSFLTFFFPKF